MNFSALEIQVLDLFRRAGLDHDGLVIKPMRGGRNNQVFAVTTASGAVSLFKRYFHHPGDSRDRLRHETAFLTHLENVGCDRAPRLLACNPGDRVALLEFVHGAAPTLASVGEDEIAQACEFYRQANRGQTSPLAQAIPNASEACFSIEEHLRTAQRRVDRLHTIVAEDDLDRAADEFARSELLPVWQHVRAAILNELGSTPVASAALPEKARCLSPSDFGFHNTLRETSGAIRFLDFEYAGWDDPAKLVCDFANQPDMLLTRVLSDRFKQAVFALDPQPDALEHRVNLLEPLYQIKWACICLNDFLPAGRSRRTFTGEENSDPERTREAQLRRARQMLARVGSASPREIGRPTPLSNLN